MFAASGMAPLSQLGGAGGPDGAATPLFGKLPTVHGSWGTGRLFQSALVTALFTDDGRAYLGAVDPDLLYQAAAAK